MAGSRREPDRPHACRKLAYAEKYASGAHQGATPHLGAVHHDSPPRPLLGTLQGDHVPPLWPQGPVRAYGSPGFTTPCTLCTTATGRHVPYRQPSFRTVSPPPGLFLMVSTDATRTYRTSTHGRATWTPLRGADDTQPCDPGTAPQSPSHDVAGYYQGIPLPNDHRRWGRQEYRPPPRCPSLSTALTPQDRFIPTKGGGQPAQLDDNLQLPVPAVPALLLTSFHRRVNAPRKPPGGGHLGCSLSALSSEAQWGVFGRSTIPPGNRTLEYGGTLST